MGLWKRPTTVLPKVDTDCVIAAGGVVLALPPQPPTPAAVARVLDAVDGLIVTGGKDVDARLDGQEPHPENDAPRPDRDAWEIAVVRAAVERDLPFLGICRDLQVLNVALGGTLRRHLPDVIGLTRYGDGKGTFAATRCTPCRAPASLGYSGRSRPSRVTTTRHSIGSPTASR
jgi:putative glutamine amidotransferase